MRQPVLNSKLASRLAGRPTVVATHREQASAARDRQLARQGKPNARVVSREVDTHCVPEAKGADLLAKAIGYRRFERG